MPFLDLTFTAVVVAAFAGSPRTALAADDSTLTAPKTEPKAGPSGSVFVDPLGFLLFGPTVGIEIGVNQISAIAYGRWLNAGVLTHSLFLNAGDTFAFSFGAGLKGRYYFSPNLVGPHVGLACELLKSRTENNLDLVATNNWIVVPELEGGYRFGFGRFYVDGSAAFGYAVQASKSVENINGGSSANNFNASDISTVYGSASIDLGLFF
jgi:hypothetical protein